MMSSEETASATVPEILASKELFLSKENNELLKNKNRKGSEPAEPVLAGTAEPVDQLSHSVLMDLR